MRVRERKRDQPWCIGAETGPARCHRLKYTCNRIAKERARVCVCEGERERQREREIECVCKRKREK